MPERGEIMRGKIYLTVLFAIVFVFSSAVLAQKPAASRPAARRSVTVLTEPNAQIWIDGILRGAADADGLLTIKNVPAGLRKMRVRASGFKESSINLAAAQKGEIKVVLTPTTDEAELAFQQAESSTDRAKAIELYRKAAAARPRYAEAYLGLARALSAQGDAEAALQAIREARKARPAYAEASAVEGRIYKSEDEEAKAIASFKRAIAEGKNFQPEAHTGLGLLYKEKAEGFGGAGDAENEKRYYNLAAVSLKTAITQLSGAPDAEVIYQLLGGIYEKTENYKQAIAVYEEFLRVFPDSSEATAVESFIVQIKKQMNGEQ